VPVPLPDMAMILTVAHWQIMMDAWPHWHPHGSAVTEIRLSSVSATDRPPTRGLPLRLPRPTWQTATARACVLATQAARPIHSASLIGRYWSTRCLSRWFLPYAYSSHTVSGAPGRSSQLELSTLLEVSSFRSRLTAPALPF
jgi:hypothetical protein